MADRRRHVLLIEQSVAVYQRGLIKHDTERPQRERGSPVPIRCELFGPVNVHKIENTPSFEVLGIIEAHFDDVDSLDELPLRTNAYLALRDYTFWQWDQVQCSC